MPEDIRLWQIIEGRKLVEIDKSTLCNARYKEEDDLEAWLSDNISLIDEDFLVIGKQVKTTYGKEIDLLCIDRYGDIIIIELKRNKTPRDVVAQVLDYASWVEELSFDDILEKSKDYLQIKHKGQTLYAVFKEKFGDDLPETVNEKHRMLIVASAMDDETERIIKYLSGTYGVDINFIRFQFFKNKKGDNEILARVFLIDPAELNQVVSIKSPSKRKANNSVDPVALFESGLISETDDFIFRDNDGILHEEVVCRVIKDRGRSNSFLLGIESIQNQQRIIISNFDGNVWSDIEAEFPVQETAKKCSIALHRLLNNIPWPSNYSQFGEKNFVRKNDNKDLSQLRMEYRKQNAS